MSNSNFLSYVLVGVGAAAVTGVSTYFVTKRIVTKKCKEKYENELSNQLNQCRAYYKANGEKISLSDTIPEAKDVEYETEESAKEDNGIEKIVVSDTKITGTAPKKTASEIAQENAVVSYHKMYGEPTLNDLWDDEPEDAEDQIVDEPKGPYLIKQAEYYREEGYDCANMTDEFILFTGDFIRDEDGNKEYIEILYHPDDDRVVKSAEAAMLLGQEWRHRFGDNTYDPETGDGYDYDADKVCVRNNAVHTDYCILRDDRMYKCAIAGLEPGDPFDYDSVR